jgi:hypothetical protein
MQKFHALLFAVLIIVIPQVQAGPITGVTATTNMGAASGSAVSNLVDGSGLSSYTANASHDKAIFSNAWLSNPGMTSGTVTFNLNGVYALTGMVVWNFNATLTTGVQNLTMDGSNDGTTFSSIAGAPTLFAQGAAAAPEFGQAFNFSTTTSFVRFNIGTTYGTSSQTGLSEVMFLGTSAVPEPATFSLLGGGLLAFAVIRRRFPR